MNSVKDFIEQSKRKIKKDNHRINDLNKEIGEYEALICVISQIGNSQQVMYYREKINQCYSKIDAALEDIKNSRDLIATMKVIDKIIKRGEKCA